MQLSDFQNHTGFYPDESLFKVIEREREAKTDDGKCMWSSDAQFCNAYKFNDDGIAQKCQRLASEEIWRRDEQYREAQAKSANRITDMYNEIKYLRDELTNAHNINSELMQRVEDLEENSKEYENAMQNQAVDKIRTDMFSLLEQYVRDDVDLNDIGRAVVSFYDLLKWREPSNAVD